VALCVAGFPPGEMLLTKHCNPASFSSVSAVSPTSPSSQSFKRHEFIRLGIEQGALAVPDGVDDDHEDIPNIPPK
jgi:hypothetical protein